MFQNTKEAIFRASFGRFYWMPFRENGEPTETAGLNIGLWISSL